MNQIQGYAFEILPVTFKIEQIVYCLPPLMWQPIIIYCKTFYALKYSKISSENFVF